MYFAWVGVSGAPPTTGARSGAPPVRAAGACRFRRAAGSPSCVLQALHAVTTFVHVLSAAARERHHVIAGERLARAQLHRWTAAVLAGVVVAREEERVRDLAAEPARHVNELREADDDRAADTRAARIAPAPVVGFDDLRLAVDHEAQCPSQRHHRQGLERRVQRQAAEHQRPLAAGSATGHGSQPAVAVRHLGAHDVHVLFLQAPGDRAGLAAPDRQLVDRPDRRDLRGRPAEERFVGDVEELARHHLSLTSYAEVRAEPHDGIAGDAVQDAGRDRRRVQDVVANHEQVLPAALGHEAVGVEHDPFGVLVEARLHRGELRVQIVARRPSRASGRCPAPRDASSTRARRRRPRRPSDPR